MVFKPRADGPSLRSATKMRKFHSGFSGGVSEKHGFVAVAAKDGQGRWFLLAAISSLGYMNGKCGLLCLLRRLDPYNGIGISVATIGTSRVVQRGYDPVKVQTRWPPLMFIADTNRVHTPVGCQRIRASDAPLKISLSGELDSRIKI